MLEMKMYRDGERFRTAITKSSFFEMVMQAPVFSGTCICEPFDLMEEECYKPVASSER